MGIRSSGYFGAPSDRVDVLCRRRAFAGLEAQPGDVLWISYGDEYNGHAGIACKCRGHALRSRPPRLTRACAIPIR